MRVGYACQNLSIQETTNRTLRLANLGDADKVRGIVEANLAGLRRIVEWNASEGIGLFRIGQSLIPFASHPAFPYDWQIAHRENLADIGNLATVHGIRLSMHPGQYIQPGSPNPDVVRASIAELEFCTALFTALGTADPVVVLHVGGAYGEPDVTAARYVETLSAHPEILSVLALENDERIWTVEQVVPIGRALGVPAIVDTLHHRLNPGSLTLHEAFASALPTWDAVGRRPKVHISSQDPVKQAGAHAYGIDPADWQELIGALSGADVDVMIEAKGKDKALLDLRMNSALTDTD
jgi:UV DNA damage endonuclease